MTRITGTQKEDRKPGTPVGLIWSYKPQCHGYLCQSSIELQAVSTLLARQRIFFVTIEPMSCDRIRCLLFD